MLSHLKNPLCQFFIDGYHKVPNPFYQLLTIYYFDDKNNFYTPIFHILMDSKEEAAYDILYRELDKILVDLSNDMKCQLKVKDSFALTTDFEKALINSSNRYLKHQHSKRCFFHYLQLLWRHAGLEHLKTNELMKLTSIMITGLTLLAFISEDKVIIAFEKLRSYILNQVKDVTSYTAFFEYYENNWIYGNIPIKMWNFYTDSIQDFAKIKRTNNCVESFHSMLSRGMNKVFLTSINVKIFRQNTQQCKLLWMR